MVRRNSYDRSESRRSTVRLARVLRAAISSILAGAASASFAVGPALAQARRGGAANIATIGEPPTLDPMDSPADVVGMISQHMFETLYTWGKAGAFGRFPAPPIPRYRRRPRLYDPCASRASTSMTARR